MRLRNLLKPVVAIAMTFATAASAQQKETPTAPSAPAATFDDKLVKIGELAPGFGGMYFDDKGALQVYMKNAADLRSADAMKAAQAQVSSAIASVLGVDFLAQNAVRKGRAQESKHHQGRLRRRRTRQMEEERRSRAGRSGDRLRRSRRAPQSRDHWRRRRSVAPEISKLWRNRSAFPSKR